MAFEGLNPGDETRRHGDYVGFPHGVADGTAVSDLGTLDRGVPVVYDKTNEALVPYDSGGADIAAGNGAIAGVLYAFDVYGDSSNAGPYIDGSSDATVKTSGTVIADLTSNGGITAADEGTAVGPNGELYIVEVVDETNNLAEVRLR